MLKKLWKKIAPNPLDRRLKKAAKQGCKSVLIPWNRGLGDIAAANPGGEVLIISHGGAIRAVRQLLGARNERMPNLGASWFLVQHGQVIAGDLVSLIDAEPTGMAL